MLNVSFTFTSLFGYIFVMTSGGPGFDTTTLDYYVYNKAFVASQFGIASALALILFVDRARADGDPVPGHPRRRRHGRRVSTADRPPAGAAAAAGRRSALLGTLLLIALAVTTVYPLVFLVLNSMKTQREYTESPYALPGSFDLSNLDDVPVRRTTAGATSGTPSS